MQALVKSRGEVGLWLEEVAVPEVGINDVLIKILKTSICGTDVHIWNWDAWAQKTIPVGLTIGHEFVGVVERFGENVHDYERAYGLAHLDLGHLVLFRVSDFVLRI